ncbi:hypothetical protein BGX34_000552 [Mortierella sp. NVP85]|nr:hypothetical protein BGX34_000552 [Mortierella sp. NVP85]
MPRPTLTHFLSIPLYTTFSAAHLNASLGRFAAEVTDPSSELVLSLKDLSLTPQQASSRTSWRIDDAGSTTPSTASKEPLPTDALSPPSSLHLTLGVMSLDSPGRIEDAVAFLKTLDLNAMLEAAAVEAAEYRSAQKKDDRSAKAPKGRATASTGEQVAPSHLTVKLQGLRAMGSVDATTVLYAVPYDSTYRLRPLCEALRSAFTEAGFVVAENRPLKLHATVVNTINVRGREGGSRNKNEKLKIDATELVEKWRSKMWAKVRVEKVVICEMGKKKGEDGLMRYVEIAQLDMPAL